MIRKAPCLLALGAVALTAGCVQDAQYPTYSSAYSTGYGTTYSPGYSTAYVAPSYSTGYSTAYAAPSYPTSYVTAYSPGYTYAPTYTAPARSSSGYWNSARRDADRDGIPNRYDRDANGDRIPDRYQGR